MNDQFDTPRTIAQLTLAEKAALVSGADFWHTVAVERLGIPAIMCADGPHGLRAQLDRADHVGLSGSVPATCFPTASAIASSWDVDLLDAIGKALAIEAHASGVSVVLGPGVNIKRSPLCGRNFEYFSEDPYLSGELGVALVDGIQSGGVGASVKHFAANNQEHDRLRVSVEADERTLREIYLLAFERVVTGSDPWTVMCAYNRINGVHCSQHSWLLTEVLRDDWGYDGVVVSDWGAVHDRVAALQAGLDWEMPPDLPRSPDAVVAAVSSDRLDMAVLDRSVDRMLRLVQRATAGNPAAVEFDEQAHHALARRAAGASVVLLRNDHECLPLSGGPFLLVGEFARTPRFQGAGSSQVNPTRVDVLLDQMTAALGADQLTFAAGYRLDDQDARGASEDLVDEAVAAARGVDTVVCVVGLPASYESEGFDRSHIELPSAQQDLVRALVEVNPNVVVVIVGGSVVQLHPWADAVPAVVQAWLGGQAAAGGIADVLTGAVNPSGRLAETIPRRLEDCSAHLNFPGDPGLVRYGEGVFVGYRSYDALDQDVSHPFGFGLSYTTFDMAELAVTPSGSVATADLAVAVSVVVTNTGPCAGAEVVQVYVSDPASSVARPPRELRGFARVFLEQGASATVRIDLDQRAFSFWSSQGGGWVVEPGTFVIAVGRHSRDLTLSSSMDVEAPSLSEPLTGWSTLAEWLADPVGRDLLMRGADQSGGGSSNPLADPELVRVIGSMPLATLAGFPGIPISHDDVSALVVARQAQGC